MTVRLNVATPEGKELGGYLARFYEGEISRRQLPDQRCATCAFRGGDHVANGSPETLMSALKCAMEGTPFWCHEADIPCAGWVVLRFPNGRQVHAPWEHAGVHEAEADVAGKET